MATAFPVGTWAVPGPPTTFTHRVLADEFIFRTNGSYEVLEVVMAGSPSFACQLPLVPAPAGGERPSREHLITTRGPIADHWQVEVDALRAHATQIDPASSFWFGLPDEVGRSIHTVDEYRLEVSQVGHPADGEGEEDLFIGIRPAGELAT